MLIIGCVLGVLQVVPMEGECTVNDEPQKRLQEMTKEIEITKLVIKML